jgi:hypothetical protein
MKWQTIRQQYPQKWILAEALEAYTEENRRIVEQWAVIDAFSEFFPAMDLYHQLHKKSPQREMYVAHTDSDEVQIKVRHWHGVRSVV